MKVTDICFYMSITKEENSAFILAHPNEDKEGVFTRHGSIKALARAGSYRYSKVTSIVASVGMITSFISVCGGSEVYSFWGRGQWGGHNCSWGARTYIATVNHPNKW